MAGLSMGGMQTFATAAFEKQIRSGCGERADVILSAYPHSTDVEASRAFAWPTWAWARMQSQKGKGKAFDAYYSWRREEAKKRGGQ